ncbi:HNH endonuclease signature motif containing protein [Paenibacillus amylolyticus]|uniref:HNH endonuclease signature motif containing protein n=2 Tax=Paenibacillus TaxID=44249 RepID=UPI003EBD4BD6
MIVALSLFFTMSTSAFATIPEEIDLHDHSTEIFNTYSIDSESPEDLPTSFSETLFSSTITPESADSESSLASKFILITIKHDYTYVSSKKEHKHSFNIDAPGTLIKPPVDAIFKITRSDTENGIYTEVDRLKVTDASYIKTYNISIPRATGHYKVVVELTARKANQSVGSPVTGSSQLINKTGNIWIFVHTDSTSGKTLAKPPANYTKGALYTRPSNLNKTYETWYNKTYSAKLDVTDYDVHHIKPLEYGGDNTMGNLIHLNKLMHKGVTAWFAGY